MSNQAYLQGILESQKLSDNQIQNLRDLRKKIQSQLERLKGNPTFYYAGSYAKHTMIKASYDLDIVAYWPQHAKYSLKEISDSVKDQLQKHWDHVNEKTVAWELPFEGNFHIDVVPGRALDSNNHYANLYRKDNGQPLKTSIKVHIDTVRNSDRRDALRLVKLWKVRNNLPFMTFILEQMVIEGCKGATKKELEPQLNKAFRYIYEKIGHARILDPANSNNILSNEMTTGQKNAVKTAAKKVLDAKRWSDVYG
ncbi:MAG: nucleotidyltransferase [Candidatus Heimdallarchaeota archaeon]